MKKKYVHGLDGIRTLAILGVVFYHLTPYTVSGGFLGVNLFFIISGYLLTRKLNRLLSTPISFDRYIIETIVKRMIKIGKTQLYFLFATLSGVVLLQTKLLQNIAEMLLSSLLFVNNIWQIMSGSSYFERHFGQSVFTHLWYLSALMQMTIIFSILYFFIDVIIKHKSVRVIIIGVFIIVSYITLIVQFHPDNITRIYYGTDTRFFDFLFGALFALIECNVKTKLMQSKWRKYHYTFGSVISFILLLVSFAFVNDTNYWTYYIGLFAFDILAVYFLMTALDKQSPLFYVFENPVVLFIGKRSFSYYLLYFPVMIIYQSFSQEMQWLNVLTIVILLILVSEVFYQLFEIRDSYRLRAIVPFYKRFIKSIKTQQRHVSWFNIVKYFVLPLAWGVVLVVSPKGQNQNVIALQTKIAENARLQEQENEANQSTITTSSTDNIRQNSDGKTVVNKQVTIIGDSVTLSMYQTLKKHFPNSAIDGKTSRQFYHGVDVVNTIKTQKKLYDTVIIMLGANGPFTLDNINDVLNAIGSDKVVYFTNISGTDSWQIRMNNLFKQIESQNTNVHIIDWNSFSSSHSDWFYSDGVHPNEFGISQYAQFIAENIK